MTRKPVPSLAREAVPVAPQSMPCDGLCMDPECDWCWGWLHDALMPGMGMPAVPPATPLRVTVEVDEDTFAAIQSEALSHGVTVEDVVRGVLRQWSEGQGNARR